MVSTTGSRVIKREGFVVVVISERIIYRLSVARNNSWHRTATNERCDLYEHTRVHDNRDRNEGSQFVNKDKAFSLFTKSYFNKKKRNISCNFI